MLTRQRELLQWMVGGVSTAVLIASLAWLAERNAVSSIRSNKTRILNAQKIAPEAQGKGGGNLIVTFDSPTENPAAGELIVSANITATTDLKDLKYDWLLPEGVSLSKGAPSGDLGTLSEGSDAIIEVSLAIPSSDNKQVHLQVYRMVDGEKMGQVAQSNTLDQKLIERKMATKRETLESERSPASEKPRLME